MRRPAKIDARDPVAFAAWLAEMRPVVADIHALTVDATARKGQRRHARSHLREVVRRRFQLLTALLAAVDPAAAREEQVS
jgi:hypothetical protein